MSQKAKKRNRGQRPGQQQAPRKGGLPKPKTSSKRAPVAIGNKTYQSKVRYQYEGEDLIVSHSEYIGDVTGSSNPYAVSATYPINPGMANSFPWLSQIATRFESFRFEDLKFRFMTERPTTESGYIAVVPDYDPTDAAPPDKITAFQYQGTSKCAPWENLTQSNSRGNLSKEKSYFVRNGALAANQSLALYDSGNVFICVGGNSGAVTLGEMWVDYKVRLMTPQISSGTLLGVNSAQILGGGTITLAAPFGTAPVVTQAPGTLFTVGSNSITFNSSAKILLGYNLAGTGLSAVTFGGTATSSFNVNTVQATTISGFCIVSGTAGQTLLVSGTGTTATGSTFALSTYAL